MELRIVNLTDHIGEPVTVVADKVTHVTCMGPQRAKVHFVGGSELIVSHTVSEVAAKLWPEHEHSRVAASPEAVGQSAH
ncbi:hypothetical protein [Mesorhizobium sp. SP-1A]|uniref:hypothetical protein n=1 Tax=Mesorhizobium sp. SP-1A TaxID=3077840 RepID=UPI0028F708D1|nr:hypothetical protein [Mesorhizobium sp. SP-1A]